MPSLTRFLWTLAVAGLTGGLATVLVARGHVSKPLNAPDLARLTIVSVDIAPNIPASPSPEATGDSFRTTALASAPEDALGDAVKLEYGSGKAWKDIGEGFSGALGNSFDLSDDGQTLWMTRSPNQLVRNRLKSGQEQIFTLPMAAGLLALAPHQSDTLALSLEGPAGDVLELVENGKQRRLYPPEGIKALPALAFDWANDGKSLLLRWAEDNGPEASITRLVWLDPAARVGLEATTETDLVDSTPTWVEGPDAMGLEVGNKAWIWKRGESRAISLNNISGVWGFDPTGEWMASIDGNAMHIVSAREPAKFQEIRLKNVPNAFEADPGSFRWTRVGNQEVISFSGTEPENDAPDSSVRITLAPQSPAN